MTSEAARIASLLNLHPLDVEPVALGGSLVVGREDFLGRAFPSYPTGAEPARSKRAMAMQSGLNSLRITRRPWRMCNQPPWVPGMIAGVYHHVMDSRNFEWLRLNMGVCCNPDPAKDRVEQTVSLANCKPHAAPTPVKPRVSFHQNRQKHLGDLSADSTVFSLALDTD